MSHEVLIGSGVLSDAATFSSASPVAATMGLGNLTSRQPGDACRFLDGADASLIVDMGAAVAVNFVAALAVVGSGAADTMRIRAATSEANLTAAPGYDLAASAIWPKAGLADWPFIHVVRYIDPAQSFQWWRFDWTFSGSFLDIGRIMLDAAYVSPRPIDIGHILDTPSNTIARRSAAGGLHVVKPGQMWRELELSLNAQTEAQLLEGWLPLVRKVERSKDLFAWVDPGSLTYVQERGVHGLAGRMAQVNALAPDFYQARLRIIEQLPNSGIGRT